MFNASLETPNVLSLSYNKCECILLIYFIFIIDSWCDRYAPRAADADRYEQIRYVNKHVAPIKFCYFHCVIFHRRWVKRQGISCFPCCFAAFSAFCCFFPCGFVESITTRHQPQLPLLNFLYRWDILTDTPAIARSDLTAPFKTPISGENASEKIDRTLGLWTLWLWEIKRNTFGELDYF